MRCACVVISRIETLELASCTMRRTAAAALSGALFAPLGPSLLNALPGGKVGQTLSSVNPPVSPITSRLLSRPWLRLTHNSRPPHRRRDEVGRAIGFRGLSFLWRVAARARQATRTDRLSHGDFQYN